MRFHLLAPLGKRLLRLDLGRRLLALLQRGQQGQDAVEEPGADGTHEFALVDVEVA